MKKIDLDKEDMEEKWTDIKARFRSGKMSVHVFRAYMKALGVVRPNEYESEVRLNWPVT